MKVFTNGLDETKQFHGLSILAVLPKNVIPKMTKNSSVWVHLSNGTKVKLCPAILSADSITDLGKSMKKNISNCCRAAKTLFSSR
jgi:hypothetical protein